MVMGRFSPISIWTPGCFGPIPFCLMLCPQLREVEGANWFGPVRMSIHLSIACVTDVLQTFFGVLHWKLDTEWSSSQTVCFNRFSVARYSILVTYQKKLSMPRMRL